ncbi:hypothetical protein [Escherichia phage PJNS034]
MPDIYDRIRGNASVRQQQITSGNAGYQTSRPNVSGMEGMMEPPSALSRHVDTQEKASQFENYMNSDPDLQNAMQKVQQFAEGLRETNPNISPDEAKRQVQLFIARELQ